MLNKKLTRMILGQLFILKKINKYIDSLLFRMILYKSCRNNLTEIHYSKVVDTR
jgi:hypothetical protein